MNGKQCRRSRNYVKMKSFLQIDLNSLNLEKQNNNKDIAFKQNKNL